MTIPNREPTEAREQYGTAKGKYPPFFGLVLRGVILIVGSCAFSALLASILYEGQWNTAPLLVFALATLTLIAMMPKPETLSAIEADGTVTPWWHRLPDWSLVSYCLITGLGYNWVCVFLWFSRRYAFFSAPVVGVTGLIMGLYAAIGLLVARLTGGNWRTVMLVFTLAPCILGAIVLRLGLLR